MSSLRVSPRRPSARARGSGGGAARCERERALSASHPDPVACVCRGSSPSREMEGRLTEGDLPIPKEVNRKKTAETCAARPTPSGSHGLHAPGHPRI
ncbi:neuronal regeneration-related protein [Ochotona princeps]|uniref:neuronal regeneration-related protein n=1 Tax=Ochotona princeps TaxID=9978 RepID=UPI0027153B19|nr:neuronal regeneration-related protein [Ochotona princeps]